MILFPTYITSLLFISHISTVMDTTFRFGLHFTFNSFLLLGIMSMIFIPPGIRWPLFIWILMIQVLNVLNSFSWISQSVQLRQWGHQGLPWPCLQLGCHLSLAFDMQYLLYTSSHSQHWSHDSKIHIETIKKRNSEFPMRGPNFHSYILNNILLDSRATSFYLLPTVSRCGWFPSSLVEET